MLSLLSALNKHLIKWLPFLWISCVLAQEPITFTENCAHTKSSITIAAVGDILLHRPLQIKGLKSGFSSLWDEAIPYFKQADIVYGNLEGPMAGPVYPSGKKNTQKNPTGVYTGFPLFNYPEQLAPALKASGFDIVSTANNHVLDRRSDGVDHTIDLLLANDVISIGTKSTDNKGQWFKIINENNIKTAWIACAEHTNGMADPHKQVLLCHQKKDKAWMLSKISELKDQVDAIIITPHWGEQYHYQPTSTQKRVARQWLEQGATAVLGAHPHVLQPVEKYITKDGRETLISYSLGNFVSNQGRVQNRSSFILLVGLNKTKEGTFIHQVKYIPIYMENRRGLDKIQLKVLSKPNEIIKRILPSEYVLTEKDLSSLKCP